MYDYIDSHVRYFDKMYAKRLRTYRKTGFSIWTQELQPKQIINAIFDSVNYTEKFEQDIVESEKMVVISSPDIRQDKIDRFLLLIKKRQEVGVKVTVITTDPEDITYGKSDVCYELIRAMQLVGINVITRTEVEECFAVIFWHGVNRQIQTWGCKIEPHAISIDLVNLIADKLTNYFSVHLPQALW